MIRSSIVGNFCSISWNVSIGGGNHPMENATTSNLNRFYQLDAGKWDENSKKELTKYSKIKSNALLATTSLFRLMLQSFVI
jgi:hypothetical protein